MTKSVQTTVFTLLASTALASGSALAASGGISTEVAALQQEVQALQAQVAALQAQLNSVQANPALQLGPYVSVSLFTQNGLKGPHVIFQGANIHIVSGSGRTVDSSGLGNLVIGYNEDTVDPGDLDTHRGGSHNLIVGSQHEYIASGGIIGGYGNSVGANFASVTGGECNTAGSGFGGFPAFVSPCSQHLSTGVSDGSSVTGGEGNIASGQFANVSGGRVNMASGGVFHCCTSVLGGFENTASEANATVSGGIENTASGASATVSGGQQNTASGNSSSVGGGLGQSATVQFQNIN